MGVGPRGIALGLSNSVTRIIFWANVCLVAATGGAWASAWLGWDAVIERSLSIASLPKITNVIPNSPSTTGYMLLLFALLVGPGK